MPIFAKDEGLYRILQEDGQEHGPFKNLEQAMEYKRRFKVHTKGYGASDADTKKSG